MIEVVCKCLDIHGGRPSCSAQHYGRLQEEVAIVHSIALIQHGNRLKSRSSTEAQLLFTSIKTRFSGDDDYTMRLVSKHGQSLNSLVSLALILPVHSIRT